MILILIALIAVVALALVGTRLDWSFFSEVICPCVALLGLLGLIGYAIVGLCYFGAGYKAKIINREYGTNYTAEELFYASDVIDEVRELDRKRVEINGNVMHNK